MNVSFEGTPNLHTKEANVIDDIGLNLFLFLRRLLILQALFNIWVSFEVNVNSAYELTNDHL